MLREIRNVKQERGTGRRRWFEADGFELVVWFDAGGRTITGFQICYERGDAEHALTWRPRSGFTHSRIDPGDDSPLKNRAPVLHAAAGDPPWAEIVRRFDESSGSLDARIRQLVRDKLTERIGGG